MTTITSEVIASGHADAQHPAMDITTSSPNRSTRRSTVVDEALDTRLLAGSLRNTFRLNAALSGSTGLIAVVAGPWLATILGTGRADVVRLVGAGLVIFAGALAVSAASRTSTMRGRAVAFSIADLSWTAASLVTIGLGWYTGAGAVLVAGAAAVVCVLGVRQLVLWRRLQRVDTSSVERGAHR